MGDVVQFKNAIGRLSFQSVQSSYTSAEISKQFGISEHYVKRWTKEGYIDADEDGSYGFKALTQFRSVRELRQKGLTLKQIEEQFHGQMGLFQTGGGTVVHLPTKQSPFEKALLLFSKRESGTKELFLDAIQNNEAIADSYCNLGILAFESQDIASSFDFFSRALQTNERHMESHYNLGNLYFETGDFRLAELHFEIASKLEPDFPNIHFNLGLVQAMRDEFSRALESFETFARLSPEESDLVKDLLINLRLLSAN